MKVQTSPGTHTSPAEAGTPYASGSVASMHTLLREAIDYAGLFPPAALGMQEAVANYARYRTTPEVWALGRFVVPVTRLREFESALSEQSIDGEWRVSALAGTDLSGDIETARAFNQRHQNVARIDAIEFKSETPEWVCHLSTSAKAGFTLFQEIPIRCEEGLLQTLRDAGTRVKIRTGGLKPDAIPHVAELGQFLERCAAAKVPFKATAGLHHPIRAVHPLTNGPAGPKANMHGFINLLMAAAFARKGWPAGTLEPVLAEESPDAFCFQSDTASWRSHKLSVGDLNAGRAFFSSFGSCSFGEPINDLRVLGWL